MKTHLMLLSAATMLLTAPLHGRENGPANEPEVDSAPAKNRVQIALLLDTSNSMDGLIDQAKTQLWKVVNTFTDAKRDGEAPRVEVALYEYGNNHLSVDNQWVRQVQPLSSDLDSISKALFSLKTYGGEEYCGAVIRRSLSDLRWDDSKDTYKVIFIAGNEPFTQGPVDARKACKDALAKGVTINTIHCGSREEGMTGAWHDGAALGGGKYMAINQDRAVVNIPAPQDKEISDLGIELNKTYLGYGKDRAAGSARQQEADKDASANAKAGAGVNRAVTKAGGNYRNATWDLVDAARDKKVDPAKLAEAELPEAMRGMKPEDRAAYIEKAAKERAAIQEKIVTLNREREAFVAEEMKKQAAKSDQTLDEALVETTREQASARGYTFAK
ncbi:VWA domain-containing protein [Luteolibacter ambystomatis]|uniref:VWA domain-containing protein n=1 Tax=Luteolibacter ambystomatis TaxID=2824561 RepID=A0A975G934_9BACT|nr:vWA domain-containing protein [Luteolibacter ambystomatis]QUE50560.1 VWA domain-containing protein [Luteolibacter ambystomatis]